MKTNDIKVIKLIKSGMSFETLKNLNEGQINILYKKLVVEQNDDKGVIITKDANKAENMAKKGLNVRLEKEMSEDMSPLEKDAEQSYTGQEGPHGEKDMAPDGMDDDSDNNRKMMGEKEIKEKAVSKQQQKFMGLVKSYKEGDTKPSEVSPDVKKAAKSMSNKEVDKFASTKHKGLPKKVEESKKDDYIRSVKNIEKTLMELVQKNIPKKFTKQEFLNMIEQAQPAKAPEKSPSQPTIQPGTPTKPSKPERQNPYKPKHKPAPKARSNEQTQPARAPQKSPSQPTIQPGTPTKPSKPERQNPYKPKHKPAPKAKSKDDETFAMKLPKILQFDNLKIKFSDEKKN